MTTLKVNVADDALSSEIDGWRDGVDYSMTVRQVSPGVFTVLEAGAVEMPVSETPMQSDNPAIAAMMSRKAPR